jgi:hypothetical protein
MLRVTIGNCMNTLHSSEQPGDSGNNGQRVSVSLAVTLSLLAGVVLGIVAYRYAATRGKAGTGSQAPVAAAPPAPVASASLSNKPAVLRVDPQLIDGKMQVTISLDQLVPYDAHRLDHPDRVYIDLHGVRLAPELTGQTLFVNKGGVADIRMAQTQPDAVRAVVDLEKRFDYSVAQQSNPAALVLKLTPRPPTRGKRHAASGESKTPSQ